MTFRVASFAVVSRVTFASSKHQRWRRSLFLH